MGAINTIEDVKKEQIKKSLELLMKQQEIVNDEMIIIVKDYMVAKGKLPKDTNKEYIAYKKIMREEFGIVI